MKYIAYCRKSREEKDKQILSIEAQIAELKEFAKRDHLEIIDFVTEAKTAKVPGREQFELLLKRIEKGEAQGIVSWHPDRLARNSVDGGKIIYLLDTGKILDLKFPSFWFESTPQGKFMLNIAFGQSKYYVDSLSENVRRGIRQKIRNGVWPCKAPFGYINDPKTRGIAPDALKLKAIKRAFEVFAEGSKTFTDISGILYRGGVKRAGDRLLKIDQVKNMLSNRFYVGIMYINGEYHEGKHKTIISKEIFKKVQQELQLKNRHKKRRYDFAFMGLIKCGECGACITAESHTRKYKNGNEQTFVYYRCTKKLRPCTQPYISEATLEEQFRKTIDDVALPQSWGKQWLTWLERDEIKENQMTDKNIKKLETELKDTEIKMNKLLDGYLDGVIEADVYKVKKNELFEEKLKLEEEINKMKTDGSGWLESMKNFIGSALSCAKIARAKNTSHDLAIMGKTVGSNFFLTNRQLQPQYKKGFAELFAVGGAKSDLPVSGTNSLMVGDERIELSASRTPCERSTDDLIPVNCCILTSQILQYQHGKNY